MGEEQGCNPQEIYYLPDSGWGDEAVANAGNKARNDINRILADLGASPLKIFPCAANRSTSSIFGKMTAYTDIARSVEKSYSSAPQGAVVILQFPLVRHSPLLARILRRHGKRGIRTVLLLHDIEGLRYMGSRTMSRKERLRIAVEERSALKAGSLVIAHNELMVKALFERFGTSSGKIVPLKIFDYLSEAGFPNAPEKGKGAPVVIAGNLTREKAGYLYDLPGDVRFRLYGAGYEGGGEGNVEHMGVFPPEDLPTALDGSFGLVWDGEASTTCAGAYGEYLRINNPHKTSLYLASGLPVIIWDQAALAPFVLDNGAGLAVSSLHDIRAAVDALSDSEYEGMRARARAMGKRLRRGEFTRAAIGECLNRLDSVAHA